VSKFRLGDMFLLSFLTLRRWGVRMREHGGTAGTAGKADKVAKLGLKIEQFESVLGRSLQRDSDAVFVWVDFVSAISLC